MDYYLEETKNINNKPNFARVLELELADVIKFTEENHRPPRLFCIVVVLHVVVLYWNIFLNILKLQICITIPTFLLSLNLDLGKEN